MEILVMGAGARGSYLGARLIEERRHVAFLTGPERRASLMTKRMVVTSQFGRFHRPVFTPLPDELRQLPQPVKLVIFACRAHLL